MSYDLMVFNKDKEFANKAEFLTWYDKFTEYEEGVDYNDYKHTTQALQNFFLELIQFYPPLNGEFYDEDKLDEFEENDIYGIDHSIGQDGIYLAFAWSNADDAYDKVRELAIKHQVGFFDVSGDNGDVIYPNGDELV